MSEHNHINYSSADIEKYWTGKLSAAEQHAMEKAALDDPFLADAMEGYEEQSHVADPVIAADNLELQKRLANRIAEKQSTRVIPFAWWKVAAILIVLVGAGWLYNSVSNKSKENNIAKNDKKEMPVPTIADSIVFDSSSITSNLFSNTDTLRDVAINKKTSSPGKYNPAAPEASANDELEAESIATTPNAAPAIKRAETYLKSDTLNDKDNALATLPATKKEADKSIVADQLEQKAKGIAADDYKVTNEGYPGRAKNFSNTFNGNITDQANKPVANAFIQIPNLKVATQTDRSGYFSFQAPDTSLSVSIASVGFETQNFHLRNNEGTLNQIVLTPVPNNLKEVVVQSNGAERKKPAPLNGISIKILDAEPIIGWEAYNDYLDKNKKITDGDLKKIHGTVVVAFQVRSKYLTNFEIEKSLDEELDAEAIRLIKQGPAWKLLKGKKANVTVVVKF